jgi:hypothetical protein
MAHSSIQGVSREQLVSDGLGDGQSCELASMLILRQAAADAQSETVWKLHEAGWQCPVQVKRPLSRNATFSAIQGRNFCR